MTRSHGEKIFCAIDTRDPSHAHRLGRSLKGSVGGLKLGLEFYSALGREGVTEMTALGLPVFLDLKLHDIPNTVAGAITALAPLRPAMITLHTQGGLDMLKAARTAAAEGAEKIGARAPLLLGVTVLTSLDESDLKDLGIQATAQEQVLRLAAIALKAGLGGIVCSPMEISAVKKEFGAGLKLVVPGIRPEGAAKGDQKRTMTPFEAIRKGADYLVIGRPITTAPDPAAAARSIAESLAGR